MEYDDLGWMEDDEDSTLELVGMMEIYGPDERDEVMVILRDATRCYTIH